MASFSTVLCLLSFATASIAGNCTWDKRAHATSCPWDKLKLKFKCTNPTLEVGYMHGYMYDVQCYSGAVACGNMFREKDIGGKINVAPTVPLPLAIATNLYTFIMTDPDGIKSDLIITNYLSLTSPSILSLWLLAWSSTLGHQCPRRQSHF